MPEISAKNGPFYICQLRPSLLSYLSTVPSARTDVLFANHAQTFNRLGPRFCLQWLTTCLHDRYKMSKIVQKYCPLASGVKAAFQVSTYPYH